MPFKTAKAKLSAANQTALDSLLSAWAGTSDLTRQAATNLQNEHGSAADKLEDYLDDLANHVPQLSVGSPKNEFEQVGRAFALAGHEAAPFQDAIFGRAMLLDNYARYVSPKLDEFGYGDTAEVIRATIRKLDNVDEAAAPTYLEGYYRAIRETPLGKRAIFATFAKPVCPGQRPWALPIPSAKTIRNTIALGEDDAGQDYILFAYRLPAKVVARVPTTASPGWFYQKWFRPNLDAAIDFHGLTEPLEPGFTRLPEIVHEEIPGATVVFPIHIATA